MQDSEIVERIQKLLRLSKDAAATPAEAALAASKAQELLTRYHIDLSRAQSSTLHTPHSPITENSYEVLDESWRPVLFAIVGRAMFCKPYKKSSSGKYIYVGRIIDIEAAYTLYQWIERQLEFIAYKNFLLYTHIEENRVGNKKVWYESFYLGAVNAVKTKLQEAQNDPSVRQVMVSVTQEISVYLARNGVNLTKGTAAKVRDRDAYDRGIVAGKSVQVKESPKALTGGGQK